jgi:dihydrofolate synthase/folylpolyglutamate synthase
MSYVAAVEALHGLGQELASWAPPRKFDLAQMRVLAAALGDPQKHFPAVLIAGTNGKGSTAATLASICAAAGMRTALYTSPHLSRVTERIRIAEPTEVEAGRVSVRRLIDIPEEDFARLYFLVDETAQRLVASGELPHAPSFFESMTTLAFLYFAEHKVEIAILEVGLGGRLDATNIVDPMLSVITDIALDHQEYLGETVAAIAREKAGILRRHGTLVTLPQHVEANRAIAEAVHALDVRGIDAAEFIPGHRLRLPRCAQTTTTLCWRASACRHTPRWPGNTSSATLRWRLRRRLNYVTIKVTTSQTQRLKLGLPTRSGQAGWNSFLPTCCWM